MSRRGWDVAWAAWAAAVLASFGWLEHAALRRRSHPTLSTTLRRWLGVQPRSRRGPAAVVGLAAACAWLTAHLARPR